MGWFESQIEERERSDSMKLEASLRALSDAVTGKRSSGGMNMIAQAKSALEAVLGYYGAKAAEPPRGMDDVRELIEFQLQSTGMMYRPVRLRKGWTSDAIGAMLGFLKDGRPVALLPRKRGGYAYRSPDDGTLVSIDQKAEDMLEEAAYCFYRPLPQEKLGVRDLLLFMARSLDMSDYVTVVAATLAATLLGMIVPTVNSIVFGPVVEIGDLGIVGPIAALLVGVMFSQVVIGGIKQLVMTRVQTRLDLPLQAAVMMRVLSLPASFFGAYQTGELSTRVEAVRTIASSLQSMVLSTGLTSVFSLVYIGQIWAMSPALAAPAFAVILATTAVSAVAVVAQVRTSRKMLAYSAKRSGWEYALLTGVQKVKLAGAEKRAFATWADVYQKLARLTYNGPLVVRLASTIQTAVSLVGTMALYAAAIGGGVSVAAYMAFSSAYGMVSGAFTGVAGIAMQAAMLRPLLELAEPILKTVPESSEHKPAVQRLSGGFELDNVSFAYREGQRPVLDGISLKVRPGEYVAVVGKTGCGKSTLMRLLLGFEAPQRGAVYYDGRDLSGVDASSVRRNIGVVLQDGKLFMGSIYDNISISAPGLTMDEAWKAAELAGIADDIRAMPMGMNTFVTETGGGVSGGQRQRLMIARAIAPRPKILMFDEATSALDNVTQRIVSDSLDELKCTRLVIAHRLSTIRHCDRILVLDGGKIVEDGTYEELIEQQGLFADLVSRQQA